MAIIPKRRIIYGCEQRGDVDQPYLTRWVLLESRWLKIFLHVFHRSDHDRVLHDHPWAFLSVILWRGYLEETPTGKSRKWPGMILFRPAHWTHRVALVDGKPAVSLVICGPHQRPWGFYTPQGWIHWAEYFQTMGCED